MTLFLVSLATFIWIHFMLRAKVQAPSFPVFSQLPAFSFIDQDGKPFGSENLMGKVWIADFIFTSCQGPCPIMSSQMSRLHRNLAGHPEIQFVSFTVNPTTDTPEVLRQYASQFHADFARWHFLTGEQEKIARLSMEGFLVGNLEDPLMHSTKFILVDPQGQTRGHYDGTEFASVRQLENDVRRLATAP
jgi:protein SCO1/2